jgi:hypothetical protein
VALLLLRSDSRMVSFALIALGYAGLFFCVQLVGRGTGGIDPEVHGSRLDGARYVLVPFLMLTTTILALVDHGYTRRRMSGGWMWARRAAFAWLAALVAVNYSVTNDRSRGPRWDRELGQARATCSTGNSRDARVLVAPSPPRVWFATIPCGLT